MKRPYEWRLALARGEMVKPGNGVEQIYLGLKGLSPARKSRYGVSRVKGTVTMARGLGFSLAIKV